MPAYFADTVSSFLQLSDSEIRSRLDDGYSADGFNQLFTLALDSWREEVSILRQALMKLLQLRPPLSICGILLEFWIPRRMRRADVVLLIGDVIVVIEFKSGDNPQSALPQVEDYALDLADFHEPTRNKIIFPLVIARTTRRKPFLPAVQIQATQLVTPFDLASVLQEIADTANLTSQIDLDSWNQGQYHPVPTILEAARAMFAEMEVRDIACADAESKNLTATIDALRDLVADARKRSAKLACFVTGVPGAGKTLAGLRVVHDPQIAAESMSCLAFLSGNAPLVKVLQHALTDDVRVRRKVGLRIASRDPETLIQGVYGFKKALWRTDNAPVERIIVFDEAQRAWDREHNAKKLKAGDQYPYSEPALLLEIMGRHEGWAVLVALIGSGQEIHEGEAGLAEWGRALNAQPPGKWEVRASSQAVHGGEGMAGAKLFEQGPASHLDVRVDERLHLDNPKRQFRGKTIAKWVDSLLAGDSVAARNALAASPEYSVVLTRDLETARDWLRLRVRGTERYGLVASSGAGRLRAYGIETDNSFHKGIPIEHWFLKDSDDYRSSFRLEVATTEFEVQGLELDWVGVCWGGDMLWSDPQLGWDLRHLLGPTWKPIRREMKRRYTTNTYRVLLTRARKGMVIFVPKGKDSDPTIAPEGFDRTAELLSESGCELLAETTVAQRV